MNLQHPPENSDSEFKFRLLLEKNLRSIGQFHVIERLAIRIVKNAL